MCDVKVLHFTFITIVNALTNHNGKCLAVRHFIVLETIGVRYDRHENYEFNPD